MGAKIFVGNLHPRTTKSELAGFFSAAGRVASISIPVDRETGEPRSFCFVEFSDRESAEEAFALCDGRELDGHRLRLSWAREEGERSPARRAKWRRDWVDSSAEEESKGSSGDTWQGTGWTDDYSERRRGKRRRQGRHGRDRKRSHGIRRVID